MRRTLGLAPHLAEQLKAQITQDANFLAGHGIIDYSLLVGMHRGSDIVRVCILKSRFLRVFIINGQLR